MWFFESSGKRKQRIAELANLIVAWISHLDRQPTKEEISRQLEIVNQLSSATGRMRGFGLNRATNVLLETLNVWLLQAGNDSCALQEDPRYKNVVSAVEKLVRAIGRM